MVEGALTFPLMALVTLALVNLALAGFASTTANHAAGYGARAGSVAQVDPAGRALEAAQQALRSGVGDYAVRVTADTYPGGVVRVEVDWSVPNLYGSLMPLFGVYASALVVRVHARIWPPRGAAWAGAAVTVAILFGIWIRQFVFSDADRIRALLGHG
jgi:hypothetical protein